MLPTVLSFIRKSLALALTLFFLQLPYSAMTQDQYWIFYKDKAGVAFNPYEYFDEKAIERRLLHNLPLDHSSDFPLNTDYTTQVENVVELAGFQSRWFNAQAVIAFPHQIEFIQSFEFVDSIVPLKRWEVKPAEKANYENSDWDLAEKNSLLRNQLENLEGEFFLQNKISGKGVRVAIFDVGFRGVDKHPAFEHIRSDGKILKTYDFVKKDEFVYDYGTHGRMVLSCIAGVYEKKMIGLATDSEFLLARTEYANREPFSEEVYWMEAAEWADKNGADIINSSLGYTHHRYFVSDMDGQKALVSRAATMAARKGILVINAMGNSGTDSWKYLAAPADADSILSIAAIDPNSLIHTSFSSFGPTADRRLKPNLTAFGHVMAAGSTGLNSTQGTSFSTPLISGFAACLKQLHPEKTAMELLQLMQESGHLYPYFDYAHGYGVPKASHFFSIKNENETPTFQLIPEEELLKIVVNKDLIDASKDYLFYHIETNKNYLSQYFVVKVSEPNVQNISLENIPKGSIIRVHYRSYTETFDVK